MTASRFVLADHHDELAGICLDIEIGIACDDPLDLVKRYRAFEHAVEEHLTTEEAELLPRYSEYDAGDASAIREQHTAFRAQLFAAGIEVELHAIRATTLRQMIETLRAHSLHEERGMYPWAQVHLPHGTRNRLVQRIGQSIDTLARLRRAFADRTAPTRVLDRENVNE